MNLTQTLLTGVQGRWEVLDGGIEQRVGFSFTGYDRKDNYVFFPADYQGETRTMFYQADLHLTEQNVLTAGVDYLDEHGSNNYGTDADQHKYGIYLQDQFQIGQRLFNTIGFRWDDWNTAGLAETYQFRSVYQLEETNTAFRGTLGTGFRAPSLSENVLPFGNPALRPEQPWLGSGDCPTLAAG